MSVQGCAQYSGKASPSCWKNKLEVVDDTEKRADVAVQHSDSDVAAGEQDAAQETLNTFMDGLRCFGLVQVCNGSMAALVCAGCWLNAILRGECFHQSAGLWLV